MSTNNITEKFIYDAFDDTIVRVIDTDSVFIKKMAKEISEMENIINNNVSKVAKKLNYNLDDFVSPKLKFEYKIERIISYTKKRYIAFDGKNVILKGIEGKRTSYKFVDDLLSPIIGFVKTGNTFNVENVFYNILDKLIKSVVNFNFEYFELPINVGDINKSKTLTAYMKGIIVYNELCGIFKKSVKTCYVPIVIKRDALAGEFRKKILKIKDNFYNTGLFKKKQKKTETIEDFLVSIITDLTYFEDTRDEIKEIMKKYSISIDITNIVKVFLKKFLILYQFFLMEPRFGNFNIFEHREKVYNICNNLIKPII